MIGQPRRFGSFDQALEFLEMFAVQRLRRAEISRDAVLNDAILLQDLIEHFQRTPAIDHEILGNNLEPIHRRLFLERI